jgi:hypothetical protein
MLSSRIDSVLNSVAAELISSPKSTIVECRIGGDSLVASLSDQVVMDSSPCTPDHSSNAILDGSSSSVLNSTIKGSGAGLEAVGVSVVFGLDVSSDETILTQPFVLDSGIIQPVAPPVFSVDSPGNG